MIQIAASDAEKELVHNCVYKLKNQLEECATQVKKLLEVLDENYLAIGSEYKKELSKDLETISACMFQVNIRLYKMQDQKARIIEAEQLQI